jgi:hypothetical protein
MRIQNLIRRFAGSFVLVSLALGYWVHPAWFLFTTFVGVNLLQSSFTKWCLLEKILYRVLSTAPGARTAHS